MVFAVIVLELPGLIVLVYYPLPLCVMPQVESTVTDKLSTTAAGFEAEYVFLTLLKMMLIIKQSKTTDADAPNAYLQILRLLLAFNFTTQPF